MAKGRVYQHDKLNRLHPWEHGNYSQFQTKGSGNPQRKHRKPAEHFVPVRKIFGEVIK